MKLQSLCWYISGLLALLWLVASLITYHPSVEREGVVLQVVFGCSTLATAGLAILLSRLPQSHWAHQSKALRAGFFVVATILTILLVLVI